MGSFKESMTLNNRSVNNFFDERGIVNAVNAKISDFPDPDSDLLEDVKWGSYEELFTPAFWKWQYLLHEESEKKIDNRLGTDILEEVTACMLGGFGIPSNVGLAAFDRLRKENLIKPGIGHSILKEALSEPITTPSGNKVHYRFVNQKSEYLASFLNREDLSKIPMNDALELREWLLDVKGIGRKTASWITRNWLGCDQVAIIDIHLLRAGRLTGIFPDVNNINTQYLYLESKFVEFCKKLNVKASIMDTIMWHQMRRSNKYVLKLLNTIN